MKLFWMLLVAAGTAAVGCEGPASPEATAGGRETKRVLNGFDVSNASIPIDEIVRGGPPRDGIPSIDSPAFVAPDEVDFLSPDDLLISFEHDGDVRAYPFRILAWHEVVNDTVGERPVAITYCPLCGTAMVFSREVEGREILMPTVALRNPTETGSRRGA